mgnify:CR=1 FL=1
MLKVFQGWVQRYFSDEEAVVLAVVLALGFRVFNRLEPRMAEEV